MMDPPWPEYGGGGRGAQNHYGLLGCDEIARVVLRAPCFTPAPDAHLWCWTTDTYLPAALALIDRAGFAYKRTFCWVKVGRDVTIDPPGCLCAEIHPNDRPCLACEASAMLGNKARQIGLGRYARGAHELCLFATRGRASLPEIAPPSVIFAARQEHSRKPDACFTEWFERVSPGPRLEMFARRPRAGWDVWGNEVTTPEAA